MWLTLSVIGGLIGLVVLVLCLTEHEDGEYLQVIYIPFQSPWDRSSRTYQ